MHVRVHVHDFCQDKLIFSFKDQNFQNVVQQAGIVIFISIARFEKDTILTLYFFFNSELKN